MALSLRRVCQLHPLNYQPQVPLSTTDLCRDILYKPISNVYMIGLIVVPAALAPMFSFSIRRVNKGFA